MTRVVPALGAAILAAAFVSVQPGVRAQQGPRIPAGLLARAQSEGGVPVIVGVRAGFTPEGNLASTAEAADQRAGIALARARVLDQLNGFVVSNVRPFETIPFFAAKMDEAALRQLEASPDVTSIAEDKLRAPALNLSVPMIHADAAHTANYHGFLWTVLVGAVISEACYSNAGGAGTGTAICPGLTPTSSTAAGAGAPCTVVTNCSHGTHVAGISSGLDYPGGPGFDGVANLDRTIPIQVFTYFPTGCSGAPCVLSYDSDQMLGLQRVFALSSTPGVFHIASVNMSLGGPPFYTDADQAACDSDNAGVKAAIDQLRSVGIATVIASGNEALTGAMDAPGCISTAVAVGSVNTGAGDTGSFPTGQVSSFSNSTGMVDLLAPGYLINSSVPGGLFGTKAGTSMAPPHVAGAWAVMKQRKPLASVTEILNALTSTGTPISDGRPSGYTKPLINVMNAIDAVAVDFMNIETPAPATTRVQPFSIAGWALNMSAPLNTNSGVDRIDVWATPSGGGASTFLGSVTSFGARPDVGTFFGAAQFTNSGWNFTVRGLRQGTYNLTAYARNIFNATFSQAAVASNINVLDDPLMSLDAPATASIIMEPFGLGGWAIDRAAAAGTGVDTIHVYAYPNPGSGTPPIFAGVAGYGGSRPDVGAAFGAQFTNSGFNLTLIPGNLPPGPYLLVAYPHSTVMGAFTTPATASVTVSEPNLSIDTPGNLTHPTQPFPLAGWSIDRGALTGTGIDRIDVWVYQDPASPSPATAYLGNPVMGIARPDVGAAFGSHFTNSGYSMQVNGLVNGHTYRLVVYGHSVITGTFAIVRTVDVIVP